MKTPHEERRLAVVQVSPDLVSSLLLYGVNGRVMAEGLPDDALFVRAWHDLSSGMFCFEFASKEFSVVERGTFPPIVEVSMKIDGDQGTLALRHQVARSRRRFAVLTLPTVLPVTPTFEDVAERGHVGSARPDYEGVGMAGMNVTLDDGSESEERQEDLVTREALHAFGEAD